MTKLRFAVLFGCALIVAALLGVYIGTQRPDGAEPPPSDQSQAMVAPSVPAADPRVAPIPAAAATAGPGAAMPSGGGGMMAGITGTSDVFTIDHVNGADQPCQVANNVVTGACTDADLQRVIGAVPFLESTGMMAGMPCHFMGGSIMGRCSPDDVARLRFEHAILVDPSVQADQPCQTVEHRIVGQCTADEIQRLAAAERANR